MLIAISWKTTAFVNMQHHTRKQDV